MWDTQKGGVYARYKRSSHGYPKIILLDNNTGS